MCEQCKQVEELKKEVAEQIHIARTRMAWPYDDRMPNESIHRADEHLVDALKLLRG